MLELKIPCESAEQAMMYLNAPQYYNLLTDLREALRGAFKHGTDQDVLKVMATFYPDITQACDHNQGAY